ncbi:MAG: membrane protein insertase YidC [Desulfobulbaceae bacterium]|nr:membrane protein insertase YidC [Desulfobulbaceae bacterium]
MDLYRTFLAIALSFIILLGYQYYFAPPAPEQPTTPAQPAEQASQNPTETTATGTPGAPTTTATVAEATVDPNARDITVDTPLYTAVISEQGGAIKSFLLKQYRAGIKVDSGPMELAPAANPAARSLLFSLDNGTTTSLPLYNAASNETQLQIQQGKSELVMTATMPEGVQVVRTMHFSSDSYLIPVQYTLKNTTNRPVQVSPALIWNNTPFPHINPPSSYLFAGPIAFVNNEREEIKGKELNKGPFIRQGTVSWAGYTDSYFITTIMPDSTAPLTLTVQGSGSGSRSTLSQGLETLQPNSSKDYSYTLYMGPKKLTILQGVGHNLAHAVNYGWLDLIAKPMLWLLNFFHSFARNYGLAIIMLTIVIKLAFWPITQKGMKSMKNMQKLQPKIAKLREKFKDDPAKMNQEMMSLYKTYKINPLGGCLPMLIQIPFFIALYQVLMAAIELRHAPFMLWINDLSMPDRLWIGFDIPYLHGLPVLTLLMGGSMYLQQKMTPTAADPMQARIMQFLPIIFTFMFLNFASGLVLYWFINNLLSMLQQYLINRSSSKA